MQQKSAVPCVHALLQLLEDILTELEDLFEVEEDLLHGRVGDGVLGLDVVLLHHLVEINSYNPDTTGVAGGRGEGGGERGEEGEGRRGGGGGRGGGRGRRGREKREGEGRRGGERRGERGGEKGGEEEKREGRRKGEERRERRERGEGREEGEMVSLGMSENIRMQSLNSKLRISSLSCCRIASPTKRGKEQLPSNMVSQR